MQIATGFAKGRKLIYPTLQHKHHDRIRPTKAIVRQAIFNTLRPYIEGARVADLFAGAGSLGLEALSAGARHVVFVECDPAVLRYLRANCQPFGDRISLVQGRIPGILKRLSGMRFDIVLADPPYRQGLGPRTLEAVVDLDLLAPGGLFVLEHSKQDRVTSCDGLSLLRQKVHGDTVITVYQRSNDMKQSHAAEAR
ncbi:MAG: 16S rRNA (guanine(966)-N(2))-methyltransferase RsmD [candidate division WOR-3 bacterium]